MGRLVLWLFAILGFAALILIAYIAGSATMAVAIAADPEGFLEGLQLGQQL